MQTIRHPGKHKEGRQSGMQADRRKADNQACMQTEERQTIRLACRQKKGRQSGMPVDRRNADNQACRLTEGRQ